MVLLSAQGMLVVKTAEVTSASAATPRPGWRSPAGPTSGSSQTMLGHKTATLTLDTYGHLWPDRLDEVSDRLDSQRAKALEKARKKADKAARKACELAERLAVLEAA